MIKFVRKRDGSIQPLQPAKINKWVLWAGAKVKDRVSWSAIVQQAFEVMEKANPTTDTVDTAYIQKTLIETLINPINNSWPSQVMAGALYAATVRKERFQELIPTCKAFYTKMAKIGLMRVLDYSEDDWSTIESFIQHQRDFNQPYAQVYHVSNRYSLRNDVTGVCYETPQFTFMRMALALAENLPAQFMRDNRLWYVKKWYDKFSLSSINAPSPNYQNLGTNNYGFASCCLWYAEDTLPSIQAVLNVAFTMTAQSAGLGGMMDTRSLKDPIRNGAVSHGGKMPYISALGKISVANKQGARGGSVTNYYTCFDPEAQDILRLQNPRVSTGLYSNRDLNQAMMLNRFMLEKALANEDVFVFNSFTAPELHRAFFSDDYNRFKTLYEELERDPKFVKKYISARKLLVLEETEANETATNFVLFSDLVNWHTPHKDIIHTSNLCVAPGTLVLTKEMGHVAIAELQDCWVEVWNGHEWSLVYVQETSPEENLIQVSVKDRLSEEVTNVVCTAYHKFYLQEDTSKSVPAITLQAGQLLETYTSPEGRIFSYEVTSVEDLGITSRVLCFKEEKRGKAVFNGVLTGQCTEVLQPTSGYESIFDLDREDDDVKGEVSMCSLSAKNVSEDDTDEEYLESVYFALLMIDQCIHMSAYPFKHIGYTAKKRLNAGVGIIGLANHMAQKGLKYSTPEGKAEIHRVCERHAYMVTKASLQLGRELGNAPWMHKTKWPEGWLYIDTYSKFIDTITPPVYHYDWEELRGEIIENKGIRNSSLINHPPTETSSKASPGLANCEYPVRQLVMNKSDASRILEWAVRDGDILDYETAYQVPMIDWYDCMGISQKFTDQAASFDIFEDRSDPTKDLTTSHLLNRLVWQYQRGIKTRYYVNSELPREVIPSTVTFDVSPTLPETYIIEESSRGCDSGSCTL